MVERVVELRMRIVLNDVQLVSGSELKVLSIEFISEMITAASTCLKLRL